MNIFLNNKLFRWFTTSSAFGYAGRTLFDIGFIIYATNLPNTELDALILQSVPENKQTSIFSIFSTLITVTVPIGTVIILFIGNFFSINIALYTLFILLLILTIYSFKVTEK